MNRGLRPVLDSIQFDGCTVCGEYAVDSTQTLAELFQSPEYDLI